MNVEVYVYRNSFYPIKGEVWTSVYDYTLKTQNVSGIIIEKAQLLESYDNVGTYGKLEGVIYQVDRELLTTIELFTGIKLQSIWVENAEGGMKTVLTYLYDKIEGEYSPVYCERKQQSLKYEEGVDKENDFELTDNFIYKL